MWTRSSVFPCFLTIAVKMWTAFGKNTEFGLNLTVTEFPGAYPPSLSASSEVPPPPVAPPRAAGALFLRVGVVLWRGLPRSCPRRSSLTWPCRVGRASFNIFISSFSSDTHRIRASRRSSTSAWPVCSPGPSTNMRLVLWPLLVPKPAHELLRRDLKPR